MQRLKIDLLKLTGVKPFTAKDGTAYIAIPVEANSIHVGAKGSYMDLSLMDNRDGPDQYDNDGFVTVDIGKERRQAGEKGPIIGNWKWIGDRPGQKAVPVPVSRKPLAATSDALDEDMEDLPF
jgi:hypothetical protein